MMHAKITIDSKRYDARIAHQSYAHYPGSGLMGELQVIYDERPDARSIDILGYEAKMVWVDVPQHRLRLYGVMHSVNFDASSMRVNACISIQSTQDNMNASIGTQEHPTPVVFPGAIQGQLPTPVLPEVEIKRIKLDDDRKIDI